LKREKLIEEIGTFLNDPEYSDIYNRFDGNTGQFPDILPAIIHKLKNKLTPILGYSQILQMKYNDDDLKKKIDKIEKNASELISLFENLKNSLVIKKPALEIRNLNSLIILEKKLFLKIKSKEIKLILSLDNSISPTYLNPVCVSILLSNTIQNAISSILLKKIKDGEIIITTGENSNGVFFSIKDNGVGIDSEDINDIWTPFFSKFPERSGLGLLTSKKMIENLKGKHSVKSVQGQHTEFTFTFPLNNPDNDKNRQESLQNKINVMLIGFDSKVIGTIDKLKGKSDRVCLHETQIKDFNKTKISDVNCDLIFVDSNIINSDISEKILKSLSEKSNDSEIFLFHSGGIPSYILNLIANGDITVIPDKTKALTITNILSTVMKKEE